MNDWELTDEEMDAYIIGESSYGLDLYDEDAVARAQARRMARWIQLEGAEIATHFTEGSPFRSGMETLLEELEERLKLAGLELVPGQEPEGGHGSE